MTKYMFGKGHPHEGELCEPFITEKIRYVGGVKMYPWLILHCKHGVDWCYAEIGQVKKMSLEDINVEQSNESR